MPLLIVKNDITNMKTDAIVNAANSSLLGGSGVDGAIHRAAGPDLLAACRKLGGCQTGQAKITKGYRLPCQYVIHAVGPIWRGGAFGERDQLISCYRSSLELAEAYHCRTVAFPLISSGIYGYPKDQALSVALQTIRKFLLHSDMTVYLVIFDKRDYRISRSLFHHVAEYIAAHKKHLREISFADAGFDEKLDAASGLLITPPEEIMAPDVLQEDSAPSCTGPEEAEKKEGNLQARRYEKHVFSHKLPPRCFRKPAVSPSLTKALSQLDESFSDMLLRKIDEKGMTDAECYKKANIDRKLFSKIRSNRLYQPSKPTVIAFAIALELSLEETKNMLMKAGFALSRSNEFDIIIEYFIERKNYDVFEINAALFAFNQHLLGA